MVPNCGLTLVGFALAETVSVKEKSASNSALTPEFGTVAVHSEQMRDGVQL